MYTNAPQGAPRNATAGPQPSRISLVPDMIQRCTDVLNFFSGLDDSTRPQALLRANHIVIQMEALQGKYEKDVMIARTQQVHYCVV